MDCYSMSVNPHNTLFSELAGLRYLVPEFSREVMEYKLKMNPVCVVGNVERSIRGGVYAPLGFASRR